MLSDVSAAAPSSTANPAGEGAAARTRRSLEVAPICIIPRILPDDIAQAIDGMEADELPGFDASGPWERVRDAVLLAADRAGRSSADVQAWLRDDILDLAQFYMDSTGARTIRARLKVVADDMCRRFHVDEIAYRLLTTYRGPGTEWIPPRLVATASAGQPIGGDAIRRIERGTVAIMRGTRGAPGRPGVLHRSPPIAGSGQIRLLLTINEAGPR